MCTEPHPERIDLTLLTFSLDVHLHTFHPGTWVCLHGGACLRPVGCWVTYGTCVLFLFSLGREGRGPYRGPLHLRFQNMYLFFREQGVPGTSQEESGPVALSGARLEMERGTESGGPRESGPLWPLRPRHSFLLQRS